VAVIIIDQYKILLYKFVQPQNYHTNTRLFKYLNYLLSGFVTRVCFSLQTLTRSDTLQCS